jgi:hypothetical protein
MRVHSYAGYDSLPDIIVDARVQAVRIFEPLYTHEQLGCDVARVGSQREHVTLVIFDFLRGIPS